MEHACKKGQGGDYVANTAANMSTFGVYDLIKNLGIAIQTGNSQGYCESAGGFAANTAMLKAWQAYADAAERAVAAAKAKAADTAAKAKIAALSDNGYGQPYGTPRPAAPAAPKPVHIDIGGEGRYPGAVNVNPSPVTSTTGTAGRPIPNRVAGTGEKLPQANQSADLITVENTPISLGAAGEIARVIKPGGEIRLVGPADYAQVAHQRVIKALPPGATVTQTTVGTGETAITTTVIKLP